jgi:hypothetical protein
LLTSTRSAAHQSRARRRILISAASLGVTAVRHQHLAWGLGLAEDRQIIAVGDQQQAQASTPSRAMTVIAASMSCRRRTWVGTRAMVNIPSD